MQLLEQVGVWASRHWRRNSACPQNHLLGDQCLRGSASSPDPRCMGYACAFTSNLQAGPAGDKQGLRSGLGFQAGRGYVLAPGETCRCGASAEEMSEFCWFAESTTMEQPTSRGPVGRVRGTRCGQGCQGDREAARVRRGSMTLCVALNTESVTCVSALPSHKEEGAWLSVVSVSPVCKSRCQQCLICGRLCVWPCQCPLPACVSVCASLGSLLSFATRYTCKRKSSRCIPQPGQRPQVLQHLAVFEMAFLILRFRLELDFMLNS